MKTSTKVIVGTVILGITLAAALILNVVAILGVVIGVGIIGTVIHHVANQLVARSSGRDQEIFIMISDIGRLVIAWSMMLACMGVLVFMF